MKTRKVISLARLKRDEAGAAAVEFAIVSSVFITFIFGIAYSSIMLHSNAALQWAVESAARQAALNPNITQAQLAGIVNGLLAASHVPNANVSLSVANVNGVPVASVTGSFTRSFKIPFVDTFTNTYTATARTPQNSPP
jgi:Flp pilus assembly protein TadG